MQARELKEAEKKVASYLAELDQADAEAGGKETERLSVVELKEKIAHLEKRKRS